MSRRRATPVLARTRAARLGRDRGARPQTGQLSKGSQSREPLEVRPMTNEFENFNDRDEEWLRELELRATDLENDLFDWREAHAKEIADSSIGLDGIPPRSREGLPGMLRAQPRPAPPTRKIGRAHV